MAKDITTLSKAIASQYGNLDAEYTNPATDEAWESVTQYIDYKRNKFSNPPKHKTILVKQSDGTNAEMTNENQSNVSTFVLKTAQSSGDDSESANVIDNLSSTSSTDALSANQGRILKNMIGNQKVTLMQQGEILGSFNLNETENPVTIDLTDGQETVFTAGMLYRVLMGRANSTLYAAGASDLGPNITQYGGFTAPTGQTTWCGEGGALPGLNAANSRQYVVIHNVNVEPWKGRKFKFIVGSGHKMAIASGTVVQTASWKKPYPQTSDLPWSWHTEGEEVEVTIGNMISIMIAKNSGTWNWDYSYGSVWDAFKVQECEDSIPNPPVKLKDSRNAGKWIGVLGDSILAGASTEAYKTAVDVLVSDFGMIPVLRAQAGTCISYAADEWGDRRGGQFINRVDGVFGKMAAGQVFPNGSTAGVVSEEYLGVIIMGVNDLLMTAHKLEEHPFTREWVKNRVQQTYIETIIKSENLTDGGYIQSLNALYAKIQGASAGLIKKIFLIGPYMCQWPGTTGMSTRSMNPNGDTGEDFIRIQRQYCLCRGWSYLDILGSQLNTFSPGWSGDNLHPNQNGHQMLGEHLGQLVCGTILTQSSTVFYEKVEIEDKNGDKHTILQQINGEPSNTAETAINWGDYSKYGSAY